MDGLPRPCAGAGDVVVRVRAASLNYHDIFTRRGMPGIKIPVPAIMGLDIAGEIAATGPGVSGWKMGDRVLGDPINRVEGGLTGEMVHGRLAEYCRLRAHQLFKIPDGVGFAEAVALPCPYGTARRMMFTHGRVTAGEKVLILGSNGWAREDIRALLDMVQSGRLKAVVDATYPLERAAEALRRLEDRQVFGKLAIVP